jgi:hypothetical protein
MGFENLFFSIIFFSILFIICFFIIKFKTTWGKEKNIFYPFIVSLFFTLIICAVTFSLSAQTDGKINEINEKLSFQISQKILNGEIPIYNTKDNITITPDGSITYWLTLTKPKTNYERGYIFDIGDSLVRNRMSIFVDEYGFLNWRIVEDNFIEHTLKTDINEFLDGEKFFIVLTWSKSGELIMYINAIVKSQIKLDSLNLSIKSTELYIGSDIHGDYSINLNNPTIKKYF